MCGVVCYPLRAYLSAIYGMQVEEEDVLLHSSNHVFLRLPDGRVLDPTADQFGEERVYLGPPLWFHHDKTRPA